MRERNARAKQAYLISELYLNPLCSHMSVAFANPRFARRYCHGGGFMAAQEMELEDME